MEAAAHANQAHLPDRLDTAIAATDLRARGAWWWGLVRLVQWVLLLAVVVGGLAVLYELFHVAIGLPPVPELLWNGVPARTWLLVGGAAGGLLLALLGRLFVNIGFDADLVQRVAELVDVV